MTEIDRRKFLSGASTVILASTFPVGQESYLCRVRRQWGGDGLFQQDMARALASPSELNDAARRFMMLQRAFADLPSIRFD